MTKLREELGIHVILELNPLPSATDKQNVAHVLLVFRSINMYAVR